MTNWTARPSADYRGPRIALVHGLLAGAHMERHLLTFLREAGFADTTLYSNHHSPAAIASDMASAARAGRAIALIGYSQGGFQVIKTARLLKRDGIGINLTVSVAAGGSGRLYPAQWGVNADAVAALEAVADRYDLKPALIGEIDPATPVDLRRLPEARPS